MKTFIVLALCVAAAFAGVFNAQLDSEWESYKTTYDKVYTVQEEALRRLIWEENVRYVQKHNLEADNGKHTYTVGINKYADMTNEEFRRTMNGYKYNANAASNKEAITFLAPENVKLPDTVDWRTQGYVTPIKDQGQCGSCWAFSATGSLEGQHFKKAMKLVSLSEQNLVDCSRPQGNMGCDGGWMDQAFTYIKTNMGIDTEMSYPYKAVDGTCKFNAANVGATDTGFVDIPQMNETALQVAVATIGPISVAIDAGHNSFQLYKSGVYNEPACSQTQLDHGVLAIGYGTSGTTPYWLVKNSWGTSWGMQGFIMMSRNKNNQCGIASHSSYPTV